MTRDRDCGTMTAAPTARNWVWRMEMMTVIAFPKPYSLRCLPNGGSSMEIQCSLWSSLPVFFILSAITTLSWSYYVRTTDIVEANHHLSCFAKDFIREYLLPWNLWWAERMPWYYIHWLLSEALSRMCLIRSISEIDPMQMQMQLSKIGTTATLIGIFSKTLHL